MLPLHANYQNTFHVITHYLRNLGIRMWHVLRIFATLTVCITWYSYFTLPFNSNLHFHWSFCKPSDFTWHIQSLCFMLVSSLCTIFVQSFCPDPKGPNVNAVYQKCAWLDRQQRGNLEIQVSFTHTLEYELGFSTGTAEPSILFWGYCGSKYSLYMTLVKKWPSIL